MKYILFSLVLGSIVLVEGSITTLPILIGLFVLLEVIDTSLILLPFAIICGIFLDSFALRPLGVSSIFFVGFITLVGLYSRKFEANTTPFVFMATFIGSIVFLSIFHYDFVLVQSFLTAMIAIILRKMVQYVRNEGKNRRSILRTY